MKTRRSAILTAVVAAAAMRAYAQAPTANLIRDAQHLAVCTKALDSSCVITLSDTKSYERLAPPGFDFAIGADAFLSSNQERRWRL